MNNKQFNRWIKEIIDTEYNGKFDEFYFACRENGFFVTGE